MAKFECNQQTIIFSTLLAGLSILGLGLGLGLGLKRTTHTPNPTWTGGDCTTSPYMNSSSEILYSSVIKIYTDTSYLQLHFTGVASLHYKTFSAVVTKLSSALQAFVTAVSTSNPPLAPCTTEPSNILNLLCNSTSNPKVCKNILDSKTTLLHPSISDYNIHLNINLPYYSSFHNATDMTLGFCGVNEPVYFSDVNSDVDGGGSLAQLLYGIYNISFCG